MLSDQCQVCGAQDRPTRRALVVWREPLTSGHFDTAQRCIDVAACRARVAELGDTWPLLEDGEMLEGVR